MEIRSQSKTGPLVPPLAEIPAKLSQQLDAVKQQWLDQLNREPASFARLEVEIHDHFWQWSCNPGPPGQAIRAHLGHLNIAND
jgi:hypothetical protein